MQRSAVELSLGRLRRSTGRGLGEEGLPGREGSMCKGAAVGGRRHGTVRTAGVWLGPCPPEGDSR